MMIYSLYFSKLNFYSIDYDKIVFLSFEISQPTFIFQLLLDSFFNILATLYCFLCDCISMNAFLKKVDFMLQGVLTTTLENIKFVKLEF